MLSIVKGEAPPLSWFGLFTIEALLILPSAWINLATKRGLSVSHGRQAFGQAMVGYRITPVLVFWT
jgi:hypothetical protein